MAYGLNIHNASGGVILDTTQRTGQLVGVYSHYGNTPGATVDKWGSMTGSQVSFNVPAPPANSSLWYVIVTTGLNDYQNGSGYSQISNSGNTISFRVLSDSWTYIYYGYK